MKNLLDLDTLTLDSGSHEPNDKGAMCVMEAVAFVAGEPWSDSPQCASPVIAAFCRSWNDTEEPYGAEIRERLKAYIPRLVGSRGTPDQEKRRAWLALDWLMRIQAPAWLRLAGLIEHADALAGLPPQLSREALALSTAARDAARDAAWAAASTAARDADWAAAWAAASTAASTAAWDAASTAAWAAASTAAWAAAREKLEPTMRELQASAWGLLDAMLACE